MTNIIRNLAKIFAKWRRSDYMLLHAGEMTAQERRSVAAVLKAVECEVLSALSRPAPAEDQVERARRVAYETAKKVDCWLYRGGEDKVVAAFAKDIASAYERGKADALSAAIPGEGELAPKGWRLVPEEPTGEMLAAMVAVGGCPWPNEYWAAAISTAPHHPARECFDFERHLQRQREWSEQTFGPGPRTAGVIDHIRKELREIEADPQDISEWIDVVILGLDGAWRAGYSPREIIEAIVAKHTKNESRSWPDWRTMSYDEAIEHDRAHD